MRKAFSHSLTMERLTSVRQKALGGVAVIRNRDDLCNLSPVIFPDSPSGLLSEVRPAKIVAHHV